MPEQSSLRLMVERAFDGDLAEYVAAQRAADRPWRAISTELRERHGLAVSHETLRTWYDRPAEEATTGRAS